MTGEQALKVDSYARRGCHIRITSGGYVNGFATVWMEDSELMIDDDVWAAKRLTDYKVHDIAIYKQLIGWWEK